MWLSQLALCGIVLKLSVLDFFRVFLIVIRQLGVLQNATG